jgi:hypothetical protein
LLFLYLSGECIPKAEEVLDLLVGGGGGDSRDVDGGEFGHDEMFRRK